MKINYLIGIVLLGLCLTPGLAAADKKKPEQAAAAINHLAWLAGNWRLEKAGRVIEEHWMAPAGGLMLGLGRTVKAGKLLEYEFTLIREGPGGDLYFVAQPSGQKETAFRGVSVTEREAIFENKDHDFPQQVSYTLNADGSLLAAIAGPGKDGAVKRIEFHYQRVQ